LILAGGLHRIIIVMKLRNNSHDFAF
jgi:hypothetical protein